MMNNYGICPTRYKSEIEAIHAIASKRWVTAGDIETMCGIPKNHGKQLLGYLHSKNLLHREYAGKKLCYGPMHEAAE